MKYLFLIFYSIMLSTVSFTGVKPKLCINCKYFISDDDTDKFGKCSLYPRIEENNLYFLVNGVEDIKNLEYYYCSSLRGDNRKCGSEGKMYKRKYLKKKV